MNDHVRPVFKALLAPFAPPARDDEAKRLAADLAYNQAKNDGTLRRAEDDRALANQIRFGDA